MMKNHFSTTSVSKWLSAVIILFFAACGQDEVRTRKADNSTFKQAPIDEEPVPETAHIDVADDFSSDCLCKRATVHPTVSFEAYFDRGYFLKSEVKLNATWQGCISRDFSYDTLKYWLNDLRCLEVKSLAIIGFDTISRAFNMFRNVESLLVAGKGGIDTVVLEDIFPKLKYLDVREARLDVRNSNAWLKKITILNAFQAEIIGLKDFEQAPNLEQINMGIACFSPFPKNIESLHCLRKIELQTWGKDSIDLRQIDLRKMPCLLYAYFQTWSDTRSCTMIGIPKGIATRGDVNVYVNHLLLTSAERTILKNHMDARFRKRQ